MGEPSRAEPAEHELGAHFMGHQAFGAARPGSRTLEGGVVVQAVWLSPLSGLHRQQLEEETAGEWPGSWRVKGPVQSR